ncbi:hypothetical protein R1flu_011478 [Riccia fluitans]|uniref:Uncharacterized protein n=1 Tax=Riccia fluitans TaxID=41844 RepID=A0ABD1Z8B4_9MARC
MLLRKYSLYSISPGKYVQNGGTSTQDDWIFRAYECNAATVGKRIQRSITRSRSVVFEQSKIASSDSDGTLRIDSQTAIPAWQFVAVLHLFTWTRGLMIKREGTPGTSVPANDDSLQRIRFWRMQ